MVNDEQSVATLYEWDLETVQGRKHIVDCYRCKVLTEANAEEVPGLKFEQVLAWDKLHSAAEASLSALRASAGEDEQSRTDRHKLATELLVERKDNLMAELDAVLMMIEIDRFDLSDEEWSDAVTILEGWQEDRRQGIEPRFDDDL